MKRRFSFVCILFATVWQALCADVVVSTVDFLGQPVASRKVTLTYLAATATSGVTNLVAVEPKAQNTATNGLTVFSNVLAGYYRLDIAGNPGTTYRMVVPTNLLTYSAVALLSNAPPTVAPETYLTTTTGDARYAGIAGAVVGAVTNEQPEVTFGLVSSGYFVASNGSAAVSLSSAGLIATLYGTNVTATIDGNSGTFIGDGSGLTNLNASGLLFGGTQHNLSEPFFAMGWDTDDSSAVPVYTDLSKLARSDGSSLTNLPSTNLLAAATLAPAQYAPLVLPSLDGTNKHTHPNILACNPPFRGWPYLLAYTPFPNADREEPSVAVSLDGWTWQTPPGATNPIIYNTNDVAHGFASSAWPADPEIALTPDGSQLAIFYLFSDTISTIQTQAVFVKLTSDLVTWTAPVCVFSAGGSTNTSIAGPQVAKIGGEYRLYYTSALGGTNYGTRLRYRVLASNFLSVGAENICALTNSVGRNTMPWHFDIFPGAFGGTNRWWILYGGTGAGPGSNGDSQLECAESYDGINWIPRFWPAWQPTQANTNWNAIYKPAVITLPGEGYDMFMGASSPSGNVSNPALAGWEIFRQKVYGVAPVASRQPEWNVRGDTNYYALGYVSESLTQPDAKLTIYDGPMAAWVKLGGFGSGYGAVFFTSQTKSTGNYAVGGDQTETELNAPKIGYFRTNNNIVGGWNNQGVHAASGFKFSGSGAGLTNLSVAALTNGGFSLYSDGDTGWYFGGSGQVMGRDFITEAQGHFYGDGSGVSNVVAATASYATNALGASYATNWTGLAQSNAYVGSFTGNGAGLTNVSLATATGTLPMGALTGQSPVVTNGFLTTDGSARSYSRDGQFLTNLSAAELSLGTVPSARLTGVGITNPVIYGTATLSNAYVAGPLKMSNSHAIQWPDSGGTLRNVLVYDSSDNVTLSGKSAVSDITIGQSTALVVKSSGSTVLGSATTGGSRLAVSGGVSVGTGWRTNLAPTNGIIVEGTAAFGGLVLASNLSLSIGFTNAGVSTFRDDVSLDATADFSMAGGAVMSVAGVGRFGSATVSNTLTASNVVLSAVKWVDCASHIYWATGKGTGSAVTNSVDIIEAGDGTLAMAFSQTNGTERLPFVAEVPHTIADTNATITAASLYSEAHIHVRPLTNATTLTNVAFQIVWKGCGDRFGLTNGPAVTNTITFVVGSSNTTQLVAANPMLYTTFHPSVAATFPGTWTRVVASSNNYPGPILIQTPSVHVPVGWPNAIGSTAYNAP